MIFVVVFLVSRRRAMSKVDTTCYCYCVRKMLLLSFCVLLFRAPPALIMEGGVHISSSIETVICKKKCPQV